MNIGLIGVVTFILGAFVGPLPLKSAKIIGLVIETIGILLIVIYGFERLRVLNQ